MSFRDCASISQEVTRGLAELSETLAFPEVPCERPGPELGCSFARLHASKKRLGQLASPLSPVPCGSPRHGGHGDMESSRDAFIPLCQPTEGDQQHGRKFGESISPGLRVLWRRFAANASC